MHHPARPEGPLADCEQRTRASVAVAYAHAPINGNNSAGVVPPRQTVDPRSVQEFCHRRCNQALKHGYHTFKASKSWRMRFFKQFPEVKTAKVAVQAHNRTSAANPVALTTWFQEIVVPLYEARFGKDPNSIDPRCLYN